jgi:hypothetical protein
MTTEHKLTYSISEFRIKQEKTNEKVDIRLENLEDVTSTQKDQIRAI